MLLFVCLVGLNSKASGPKSILDFNVKPTNNATQNKINLQKAIDWASTSGAALFVDASSEPTEGSF